VCDSFAILLPSGAVVNRKIKKFIGRGRKFLLCTVVLAGFTDNAAFSFWYQ